MCYITGYFLIIVISVTHPICLNFLRPSAIAMSRGEMELGRMKSFDALSRALSIFSLILAYASDNMNGFMASKTALAADFISVWIMSIIPA